MRELAKYVLGIAFVVFAPAAAYAQGSIVGLVKDASGAVLPGVTIEAAADRGPAGALRQAESSKSISKQAGAW
jgi:hypothetical protein